MEKNGRKLKGIPVWAIAMLLIIGTVAGAGIWILTVNVPVEYYEPVEIYYGSEDMETEWFGPIPLRDTRTTDATDLTYGTMHDYIRAVNPVGGKPSVNLTVEIQAYDGTDVATMDIGFVAIPDERVDPQNVTWTYVGGNRDVAHYNGVDYDVVWGSINITETLTENSEQIYTVINVGADGVNVNGYEIVWSLFDSTE